MSTAGTRPHDGGPRGKRSGLTGRKIGPYKVTGEIGKGGMGVVYRAEDTTLDRTVAIKVLPPHLGSDDEFLKRFVLEARAAAKLDHPQIIQIYQAGRMSTETGPGPCFIAMQYFESEPLSDLVEREGKLDPGRAVEITRQVAEALSAAHAAGIIHRDIKSSNILIDAQDRVKVTDFGLATSMSQDRNRITETGAYLGTPAYSSPEQCESGDLDARSDIYSLGVVLYEMLTGSVPFEARTPLKLFDKIVHEQPPAVSRVVPGLPRELTALVNKMLAKKREKRHGSAEELLSALRRVRVALGSWKRDPATGRRRAVSRRGGRVELIAAAAVMLVLLTIGGAILWRGGGDDDQPRRPNPVGDPAPPDARTPTPAPVAPPKVNELGVAIFDLVDMTGSEDFSWLRVGVPHMLLTELRQCPELVLYSRSSASEALAAAGGRDASAAARSLGARLAVSGSFYLAGDKLRFDLRVEDTVTGTVAEAITVQGGEDRIFEMVGELGQQLRASFDRMVAAYLKGRPLAAADLRSVEEIMFSSDEALALATPNPARKPAREGKSAAQPEEKAQSMTAKDVGGSGAGAIGGDLAMAEPAMAPKKQPLIGEQAAPPVPTAPVKAVDKDRVAVNKPEEPIASDSTAAPEGSSEKQSERKPSTVLVWRPATATPGSQPGHGGTITYRSCGDERVRALRCRFKAMTMLDEARTREDYSDALAELVVAKGLAPDMAGLDKLIEQCKQGQAAAEK